MGKLTDKQVKALGPGTHGDGGGLYLQVLDSGARTWLFRFKQGTKTSWAGLGGYPIVSLTAARDAALECKRQLRAGVNPIEAKKAAKAAREKAKPHAFRTVAADYVDAHKAGWKNAKHGAQWTATLAAYAFPLIGDTDVAEIKLDDVLRVLKPIWTAKAETASRVRGRIEAVLDFATVNGWRAGENPARWRGFLSEVLPAKGKVAKVEHHAALPWKELPALWRDLANRDAISFQVLKFTILTVARSGEARGATWGEIDLNEKVWNIPAARMKAHKPHTVPLCAEAVAVLKAVKPLAGDDVSALIFPGAKLGKPLTDVAVSKALGMMRDGVTVHGFRSSFRDWCAELAHCPREVAEAALAHTNRDKVEAAYARSDLLDRRRALMAAWGTHLNPPAGAAVVPLKRGAK